jgi:beta-xylosidase
VRLGNGNRIYVAELTDDFSAIKTTTYTECLVAQSQTWERTNSAISVVEGPTVIKQNGLYYLFYSANDFRNPDYAVGYAVSSSVYGPWTKYTGNPIINKKITGQHGSGHGDLIKDKDNNLLYVFHTHNTAASVIPRKTAVIELKWMKDNSRKYICSAITGSFQFLKQINNAPIQFPNKSKQ